MIKIQTIKKIYAPVLVLSLLLSLFPACQNQSTNNSEQVIEKTTILVATAANAQFAVKAIKKAFEDSQDSVLLDILISSTGKLTAQITQGAPYDILLAADMKYPNYLYDRKLAMMAPGVYARGALVLWSVNQPIDSTQVIASLKQADKIAMANPELAPYGSQTINYLETLDIREALEPKFVFGESIAQTNQYILSGACEYGFTAKSVVMSPEMNQKGNWLALDTSKYDAIRQGVIITSHGRRAHPRATKAFFEYLFSDEAQAIFTDYGYLSAED